tara:strand:+ start:2165 stop:2764 length:600 start_codon:yes stop_codon:yes gene_type:complete
MSTLHFNGDKLALRRIMRETEQMPNLSVLEHGFMVARYFEDLRLHVLEGKPLKYEWRLPEWVKDTALWEILPSLKTLRNYHIMHDCGKPFCHQVDEHGRSHFPDHASVSSSLWLSLTGNKVESYLMRHDMDIHLLKGCQVEEFASGPFASALLITGLCELHANASMFGGISSTSFKIKYKQINRRGKAISSIITSNNKP